MRAALLSVSCLILALACEGPPQRAAEQQQPQPGAPKPASTKPASDPSCQADQLQTELESFCEFDLGVPPIDLPKVAWTAEPYHPLATRVILLDNRGLTDPERAGTVSIANWLADPPRRIPEPGEMVFAIAADVPAATVAELLTGLAAAGRKQIRVLVHIGDARPIPQPRDPKRLADMRDALPDIANERVVFAAKAVQGYAETCPPVAGVFPQLVQVGPGDRCAKLAELGSKAIVACGCTKLHEIMTLLYALTVGFDVPLGRAAAVLVEIDPAAKVTTKADTTWAELAAASLKSTDLHRLWLEAL